MSYESSNTELDLKMVLLKNVCIPQKQPPEVFFKIGVLKSFANFTGKHQCWSLFLIKFQVFWCVFFLICDISKNTFFYRTPLMTASDSSFVSILLLIFLATSILCSGRQIHHLYWDFSTWLLQLLLEITIIERAINITIAWHPLLGHIDMKHIPCL